MSWWSRNWPWSEEQRERRRKVRQTDERFQQQLKEAEERQFNLEAAVVTVREQREQREALSQRQPSADPVMQE